MLHLFKKVPCYVLHCDTSAHVAGGTVTPKPYAILPVKVPLCSPLLGSERLLKELLPLDCELLNPSATLGNFGGEPSLNLTSSGGRSNVGRGMSFAASSAALSVLPEPLGGVATAGAVST